MFSQQVTIVSQGFTIYVTLENGALIGSAYSPGDFKSPGESYFTNLKQKILQLHLEKNVNNFYCPNSISIVFLKK